MGRSWFGSHISAFIVLLLLSFTARANSLHVLVLQPHHKAVWSDNVLAGVHSILDSIPGLDVYVEYLDPKRQEIPAHLHWLDSLYTLKYSNAKIEAVILADDQAYRFFLDRDGQNLFTRNLLLFGSIAVGTVLLLLSLLLWIKYKRLRLSRIGDGQNIAELKRKNYELERYAYTVSHDLRSPLVTILGFAQEMELDLQAGNVGDLTESLDRIKSAGARMHSLLEAVLQLSRVGRTTLEPKSLVLSRAVEEALANLDGKIKESKAEIILEPSADQWPEILSDYSRIVEVLQNLVENSIKYRLSDQMLVVRITAYVRTECVEVCVEDNGVGIPSNKLEQIFLPFNKLDPRTPGVGFGLALCKQIMESLGGCIWAESDDQGKGSRFWLRFAVST